MFYPISAIERTVAAFGWRTPYKEWTVHWFLNACAPLYRVHGAAALYPYGLAMFTMWLAGLSWWPWATMHESAT